MSFSRNHAAVSIVTATYNYGRYLAETIESVLAQTFPHWEMIVVDDGSTDETPQVIERYQTDSRIRYHVGQRQGPAGARHTGVRLAQSPIVAFLDADDLWAPTKLEQQLPLFDNPDVGVVYSRRLLMGPAGEPLAMRQPQLYRGEVLEHLFADNFICFSTVLARRALIESVGGFGDVPLAVDYDLLLRLAGVCQFDYVDEPLVRYRTGHANLSRRSEERLRVALSIMDRAVSDYGDRLGTHVVRQAYAKTHASLGLVCRDRSRIAALWEYGRAIRAFPARVATWKDLASLFLPEGARRLARLALGRPADWRERLPVAENAEAAQSSTVYAFRLSNQKPALSDQETPVKHPAL